MIARPREQLPNGQSATMGERPAPGAMQLTSSLRCRGFSQAVALLTIWRTLSSAGGGSFGTLSSLLSVAFLSDMLLLATLKPPAAMHAMLRAACHVGVTTRETVNSAVVILAK